MNKNYCLIIYFLIGFLVPSVVLAKPHQSQKDILTGVSLHYEKLGLESNQQFIHQRTSLLTAAFVFVGPINDLGWTFTHNEARVIVEKYYNGTIETFAFPLVVDYFDDPTGCTDFFAKLMQQRRWDIVIGTSYSFQYPMYPLTKLFPQTYFLHISGDLSFGNDTSSNWGLGFAKIHQARYLTGYLAGLMTQSNKIGNIGAVPIPETYNGINAFFFGAKDANPNVTFSTSWANVWVQADLEAYQATYLLDHEGIDILARDTDSLDPIFIASERQIYSIGYNVDASRFVSDFVLTSAIWDWSPLYIYFINKVIAKTWSYENIWAPLNDKIATVTIASVLVPPNIRAQYEAKITELMNNPNLEVFCGRWASWLDPSIDPNSIVCLNDTQIHNMMQLHPDIRDLGYLPIPTTRIDIAEGMVIAAQTLAGLGLFICLLIFTFIVIFRTKNVIRYASPIFSAVTLLGACMMLVTIFLLSPQPITQGECIASYWVLCIGFGLFYAGILVKTWRIVAVIKGAAVFKAVVIPLKQLFSMIGIIVGIEVILLILFTTINTPQVVVRTSAEDSSLDPYEYRLTCSYPGASGILLWILVGYNGLILFVGVCFTFYTKDIAKIFNESKHLALSIYAFGFALAVIVPLVEITSDIDAKYLITCLGIIFATLTAVLAFFLPKLYVVVVDKDVKYSVGSQAMRSVFTQPSVVNLTLPSEQS